MSEDNGRGENGRSVPAERLVELYERMVLIRLFEEETERQYKKARIGGYCHLSSGQEAATVGACSQLADDDLLFTSYRSHGFALARGTSPGAVMAELFGREEGCARGRGGSMHLADTERGYLGGWGIVAGQLPLAVGAASRWPRRGSSARCCANSARARSTSAPGTSRSTSPACGTCPSSSS